MPEVRIVAEHPELDPDVAYERLADFESYLRHTDAVQHVEISHEADGRQVSSWEVSFRAGRLRWSEYDEYDRQARIIRFTYRDGDPEDFHGEWAITHASDNTRISFNADFELGIPTFASIVNPIALRTLSENVANILEGLFGNQVRIVSDSTAVDEQA